MLVTIGTWSCEKIIMLKRIWYHWTRLTLLVITFYRLNTFYMGPYQQKDILQMDSFSFRYILEIDTFHRKIHFKSLNIVISPRKFICSWLFSSAQVCVTIGDLVPWDHYEFKVRGHDLEGRPGPESAGFSFTANIDGEWELILWTVYKKGIKISHRCGIMGLNNRNSCQCLWNKAENEAKLIVFHAMHCKAIVGQYNNLG